MNCRQYRVGKRQYSYRVTKRQEQKDLSCCFANGCSCFVVLHLFVLMSLSDLILLQKAAEMREKIKILQNEIEILRSKVNAKDR